jgi:hypothetical protein
MAELTDRQQEILATQIKRHEAFVNRVLALDGDSEARRTVTLQDIINWAKEAQ